ncbi:MAG: squalene synthase HpnC [Gammaproteobacteria bacterium]|nr:squalene synthase HpnC [Gammaproteobacteria bacterium]
MKNTQSQKNLIEAYQFCLDLAESHYENFPVASRLLKPELRKSITAIYAFARTADDFADEGNFLNAQRQADLSQYHQQLQWLREYDFSNNYHNLGSLIQSHDQTPWLNPEIFIALDDVIKQYDLPFEPFHRLLIAFEQDIFKKHYLTENELLSYCQNSANPVGELLLYLNGAASDKTIHYSNAICTALQLINFIQDYHQDLSEFKRLYIPLSDLFHLDINVKSLLQTIYNGHQFNKQQAALYQLQIQRAQEILKAGEPLINSLTGRFQKEIKMIYHGGQSILNELKKAKSFKDRPRLKKWDKIKMLYKTLVN